MRPVIGIVMCGSENGRQFVSQPYLDAVTDAGGLPTVLPVTGDTSLYAGFSRLCDGFLFCGGGDITPLLFGEELAMSKTPHLQYLCGVARHGKPLYHYGFIETISSGWYN